MCKFVRDLNDHTFNDKDSVITILLRTQTSLDCKGFIPLKIILLRATSLYMSEILLP